MTESSATQSSSLAHRAPAGPGGLQKVAAFFVEAAHRNWRLIVVPLFLGTTVTIVVSHALGKMKWEATGVMLFTPPPISEHQKGLCPQPDFQTLVSLIKSPAILDGLREELDLPIPVALLDKVIKVTAPRTVQTITITVQWGEPEKAAQIANRQMERYVDLVRVQRQRKAAEHLADYEARLVDCDARHNEATAAYNQFLRAHNVIDARADSEAARREIDSLHQMRSNLLRTELVVAAQRERLTAELTTNKKREDEDAEKAKELDASQDAIAENRRRQDRLKELIDEEKKRDLLLVELTSKRRDYQRALDLRNRGAGSQVEVDNLAADVERLSKQLNDSEQVKKWKDELDKIDKVIVPTNKGANTASPIIQQTLAKQLDLALQLAGVQRELHDIDKSLAVAQRQLADTHIALANSEGFQKRIESTAAERQQLNEQVGLFRRLRDQQTGEFTIISPATPGVYPAGSTRKLYLLAGLGLTIFLSVGRVCRREWIDRYHGGRRLIARTGVPVVATLTPDFESDRLAATEVRRWLPDYGAIVLVSGGPAGGRPEEVAIRLAVRLATRDERVLVVDTRLALDRPPTEPAGLADLLGFHEADWVPLLLPGPTGGVDLLPAGRAMDPDALASQLMREFLETARRQYSFVILLAPGAEHANTLDILIPYTSGALVCLGPGRPAPNAAKVVSALRDRCGGRARAIIQDDKSTSA